MFVAIVHPGIFRPVFSPCALTNEPSLHPTSHSHVWVASTQGFPYCDVEAASNFGGGYSLVIPTFEYSTHFPHAHYNEPIPLFIEIFLFRGCRLFPSSGSEGRPGESYRESHFAAAPRDDTMSSVV